MPHPPSCTARTAKITGMLRRIALILWMSSESMVNRLHIPHYYWITFTSFRLFALLTNIPYPIVDNKMAIQLRTGFHTHVSSNVFTIILYNLS